MRWIALPTRSIIFNVYVLPTNVFKQPCENIASTRRQNLSRQFLSLGLVSIINNVHHNVPYTLYKIRLTCISYKDVTNGIK